SYLTDDEGNPLRSISQSKGLEQLCKDHSIKSIYIFDENGRTIATNTDNWFFTLSTDENDQSYPFRQVLDGKIDHYLQTSMKNDLGIETQYFGVALNYYTMKDASGKTVFTSRYAFEKACADEGVSGVRKAGGITRHRSLLQIELDEQAARSILATTTAENALSTEMLSNGMIMMFEKNGDHKCMYSPVASNIGRSANELGIPDNAFSRDIYYGFNRVNGNNYFQFFRYIENYDAYIATSLPVSSMYTSRTTIAMITAAVCLILIIVLLMTVTVTSEEEELVYAALSREAEDENLNSPIFSIILPSGRVASTSKAQARWDNKYIRWGERSPEMKLGIILEVVVAIIILYFVFSAFGISRISTKDSVISYIMSGDWDRELNIFSLSAAIMVVALTIIAFGLFRIPVRLCTSLLGARGETVGHLLLSVFKYGGAIWALFYCLYLFGADSANLLASAGILSLVIGLGSQSLIKDVLAGIFIVFEGEFRVGDIVSIGGFRGTVTDIGLRTTKILGEGNI
ncbi:MAG: mechanosensitive ion channel, partial [Erysipelotrichaceae bacterium]|nr:mechanosensitive ion channel [Erysipelotrichaceae bacterium]